MVTFQSPSKRPFAAVTGTTIQASIMTAIVNKRTHLMGNLLWSLFWLRPHTLSRSYRGGGEDRQTSSRDSYTNKGWWRHGLWESIREPLCVDGQSSPQSQG